MIRLALLSLLLAAPAAASEEEARALIALHGCGTCHVIPGVPGADGMTGPPLHAMGRQPYVAGVVPNTPETLARFIADPQAIDPLSAMPDLAIGPADAALLAAFLSGIGGEP